MAEITMYNQDCIAAMQQIDTESIDLIVTDPPYNLGNFMKNRDTNLKKMRDTSLICMQNKRMLKTEHLSMQ